MRAGLVEVGEVNAHAFLPAFLGHDDRVRQPLRVPHLADDTSFLQFAGLLDDEGLLLCGLPPRLLLHRVYVRAHPQVVLDYPLRDPN